MAELRIRYGSEEELCRLLTTTLEMLPACDSLARGSGLVRQLVVSSSGLPNVSISVPAAQPTGQPSPGNGARAEPSFGSPRSITVEDPDNPGTLIEVQLPGQAFPGSLPRGQGPFQEFSNLVNIENDDGTITRQPKVPLDLKLVEAIQAKGKDSLIGDIIVSLSKATAKLLGIRQETVSEHLAVEGNTTINAVHLRMLQPVLKGAVPSIANGVAEYLGDQADIELLEGNVFALTKQVEVIDSGFDLPFISTTTAREKELYDKIRGNLEILRIQAQEEF